MSGAGPCARPGFRAGAGVTAGVGGAEGPVAPYDVSGGGRAARAGARRTGRAGRDRLGREASGMVPWQP